MSRVTEPTTQQPRDRRATERRQRWQGRHTAAHGPGRAVSGQQLVGGPPERVLRTDHGTEAAAHDDVELLARLFEGPDRSNLRERTRAAGAEYERTRSIGEHSQQPAHVAPVAELDVDHVVHAPLIRDRPRTVRLPRVVHHDELCAEPERGPRAHHRCERRVDRRACLVHDDDAIDDADERVRAGARSNEDGPVDAVADPGVGVEPLGFIERDDPLTSGRVERLQHPRLHTVAGQQRDRWRRHVTTCRRDGDGRGSAGDEQRERRVVEHQRLERLGRNSERTSAARRHGRCGARRAGQHAHLAEQAATSAVAHPHVVRGRTAREPQPPLAHHVGRVDHVTLAEQHIARGQLDLGRPRRDDLEQPVVGRKRP